MMLVLVIGLSFAVLVAEWRTRSRLVRTLAVTGAFVLYTVSHPDIHDALFSVGAHVPAEPIVSRLSLGPTERRWFMTGALTLHQRIYDDVLETRPYRWFAVGMLVWFALAPAIRGRAPAVDAASKGAA